MDVVEVSQLKLAIDPEKIIFHVLSGASFASVSNVYLC